MNKVLCTRYRVGKRRESNRRARLPAAVRHRG